MTGVLTSISHSESLDAVRVVADAANDGKFTSFVSIVIERSFAGTSETGNVLIAEQYPVLAAIWDNEDDAIYDDM